MDRRQFFKITGFSALAMLVNPAKVLAAVARDGGLRRGCTVEVLRCECYSDLQCRYLDDPEAGRCPRFKVGQKISVTAGNISRLADDRQFCSKAWRVLEPYVRTAIGNSEKDLCMNSDGQAAKIVCCPDGTRPVVFKITAH